MSDNHEHSGESYYLEQICTIGSCGAIGLVMFLLWYWGSLYYLKSAFAGFVMLGGSALMVLAVIRGIGLWSRVRLEKKTAALHGHCQHHDSDHRHGPEHDVGGECHDHYGHEHGWGPWRYAVLVLPVALFLLDLPPKFSVDSYIDDGIPYLPYARVEAAAKDPQVRVDLEGKQTHLRGRFSVMGAPDPQKIKQFGLVRLKIRCCITDAVPVNLIVRVRDGDEPLNAEDFEDAWVDLVGQISFEPYLDGYITVIWLDKIEKCAREDVRQYIE